MLLDLERERRVRARVLRLAELARTSDPETNGGRWADDRLAEVAEEERDDGGRDDDDEAEAGPASG